MGDRHGGRFARRGRALNPPARRSTRTAGWGSDATGRWAGFTPAQERSPRRKPPDTAHERKNLPRAETRPSAKASRHSAKAKEFAPRRNTPHGEGLPTWRTSKRICPAREGSPRRRPPDTAHERKDLPRGVRVRPTCRRTAGRPRSTDSQKNTPSAGSHPQRVRPLPSSFT